MGRMTAAQLCVAIVERTSLIAAAGEPAFHSGRGRLGDAALCRDLTAPGVGKLGRTPRHCMPLDGDDSCCARAWVSGAGVTHCAVRREAAKVFGRGPYAWTGNLSLNIILDRICRLSPVNLTRFVF